MQARLVRQTAILVLLCAVLAGAVRMSRPARLAASPPFVLPLPSSQFIDITARAGLNFVFNNGHKNMATMMEESGSGCAIFDYDGDGTFTNVTRKAGMYFAGGKALGGETGKNSGIETIQQL